VSLKLLEEGHHEREKKAIDDGWRVPEQVWNCIEPLLPQNWRSQKEAVPGLLIERP
jgi:hypothetical protein